MRTDSHKYLSEFLFHCINCGTLFYASRFDNCYDFVEEFNVQCGKPMARCNCPECGRQVYSTQKGMFRKDQATIRIITPVEYKLMEE